MFDWNMTQSQKGQSMAFCCGNFLTINEKNLNKLVLDTDLERVQCKAFWVECSPHRLPVL